MIKLTFYNVKKTHKTTRTRLNIISSINHGVVVRASDMWSTRHVASSTLGRILLGWVTVSGRVNHLGM